MKKTLLFISLLLSAPHLTFAETTKKAATSVSEKHALAANTIRISTRPEILGLWGMQIPNNKRCVEYYNFRGDNEVVVNSGKEWSAGLYDYQASPDNSSEKLPALIMQIKYENNEVDCSGRQENQAGEISQYFVRWQNSNTINFCASEKADQCFATLNRVLP